MRVAAALAIAACGAPPPPAPVVASAPAPAVPIDAPAPTQDEILAAIQKAMNDLTPAVQGCWAAAATERFDVEGELEALIDVGSSVQVELVRDTARNPQLAACVTGLLAGYHYAPPLAGQSFQLPFKFTAPSGQSVIDRRLVAWHGQGDVSVAVLLDENNTNNPAASMFELAIRPGGTTDLRFSERAELWYFAGPARVRFRGALHDVAAGDMMYVPVYGEREVIAGAEAVHAVIVAVPGGREGSARAGALPTRKLAEHTGGPIVPVILPASAAHSYGPATIYLEPAVVKGAAMSGAILKLPAGARVAPHVHGHETELLYVLSGSGTMTVAGTELAITASSVIQVPAGTEHAVVATEPIVALQVYTPAGPEQRFKAK